MKENPRTWGKILGIKGSWRGWKLLLRNTECGGSSASSLLSPSPAAGIVQVLRVFWSILAPLGSNEFLSTKANFSQNRHKRKRCQNDALIPLAIILSKYVQHKNVHVRYHSSHKCEYGAAVRHVSAPLWQHSHLLRCLRKSAHVDGKTGTNQNPEFRCFKILCALVRKAGRRGTQQLCWMWHTNVRRHQCFLIRSLVSKSNMDARQARSHEKLKTNSQQILYIVVKCTLTPDLQDCWPKGKSGSCLELLGWVNSASATASAQVLFTQDAQRRTTKNRRKNALLVAMGKKMMLYPMEFQIPQEEFKERTELQEPLLKAPLKKKAVQGHKGQEHLAF